MRLIDADALIIKLKQRKDETLKSIRGVGLSEEYAEGYGEACGYDGARVLVKSMPTIEERKKGKWERHYSRPNVYADLNWHCSNCGHMSSDNWANKWNFCPNCGADMRKNLCDTE